MIDILSAIGLRRTEVKRPEVSKPFEYLVPAVALAATFKMVVKSYVPAMERYLPLNYCEIYNNSTTDLRFRIESESGEGFVVAAGTSRTLHLHFNILLIINIGINALNAGECTLVLQKLG